MALSATTVFEVQTGGSATLNGGAFDPGQTAGMLTDGAATSATTAAPVFSSASYNFVAGDVGAWIYIASGTNWIPGWYKISSVAANAATLNATIGQAVLSGGTLSTVTGCATTASPTAATWSIDYSQQTAAQFAYTDLASTGAGSTCSSVLKPFGKQQVGNSVRVTGGTNFTVGNYVITAVSVGLVATVVGATAMTTGAGVNGTGGMGGCLLTLAGAYALAVGGNLIYVKSGTYAITSSIANTVTVVGTGPIALLGYGSVRSDAAAYPVITTATNSVTLFNCSFAGYLFRHLSFSHTASVRGKGFAAVSNNALDIMWADCMLDGFSVGISGEFVVDFSMTGIVLAGVEIKNCTSHGMDVNGSGIVDGCYIHNNGGNGINRVIGTASGSGCLAVTNSVIYANNKGIVQSANDVFSGSTVAAPTTVLIFNSAIVSNTSDGVGISGTGLISLVCRGSIIYGNGGWGINANHSPALVYVDYNGYGSNTSGNLNNVVSGVHDVLLSADPFVAKASANFALNSTSGGGAALKAVGFPGTTLPTSFGTGYRDVGPFQHQDSGSGSIAIDVSNTVILNRFGVAGY